MAGAGFKTFVASDVLTAAEVNTYLMQQSVMTFASDAARDSAISSPSTGMVTTQTDSNRRLTYYDGSAWQRWDLEAQTYTPTWAGSTTNPTLGGGGYINGYYWEQGDRLTIRIEIYFGTLAVAPGSGNYTFTVPGAAPSLTHDNLTGTCRYRDLSASPTVNEIYNMTPLPFSGTTVGFTFWDHTAGTPAQALWSATDPVAPAAGDLMSVELVVRT